MKKKSRKKTGVKRLDNFLIGGMPAEADDIESSEEKNAEDKKRRNIRLGRNARRAYIALLVIAGAVSVSAYMKNRAEIAETASQGSSFDSEAWQEAAYESGAEETSVPVNSISTASEEEAVSGADTAVFAETGQSDEASDYQVEQGFIRPSNGRLINEFTGNELIYSEATDDWRTHNGVDFASSEGDQVLAAADGTVTKAENDELWGVTIEIKHSDGVISRYSGLQSKDFISEGKTVKKGDIIGGVGKCGMLEESVGTHLHFEIIKDGSYESPSLYFAK